MTRFNQLKVTGSGEVYIQPDTGFISMGVTTEGADLTTIQKQNADSMNRVIETIQDLGVSNELIRTEDYRVEPIHEFREQKQFLIGYRVTHLLQVKIKDTTKIGQIIDMAVQDGVNLVNAIQFSIENTEQLYLSALHLAVRDAHKKAVLLTTSYGVRLNPFPIQIEEEVYQVYPLGRLSTFAAEATSIRPGLQKIEARIKVEYSYY